MGLRRLSILICPHMQLSLIGKHDLRRKFGLRFDVHEESFLLT